MFLHEPGDALRAHTVIPRAFGVDYHCRSVTADAQATHLGAIAGVGTRAEIVLLDLLLERLPGRLPILRRATPGAGAEKDVALIGADAVFGGGGTELLFPLVGHGRPRLRFAPGRCWFRAGWLLIAAVDRRRFRDRFRRVLQRLFGASDPRSDNGHRQDRDDHAQ